jgi:hypothetical protein
VNVGLSKILALPFLFILLAFPLNIVIAIPSDSTTAESTNPCIKSSFLGIAGFNESINSDSHALFSSGPADFRLTYWHGGGIAGITKLLVRYDSLKGSLTVCGDLSTGNILEKNVNFTTHISEEDERSLRLLLESNNYIKLPSDLELDCCDIFYSVIRVSVPFSNQSHTVSWTPGFYNVPLGLEHIEKGILDLASKYRS